jgi:N6-L-threonylcarbamoyladenine synthase
MAKKDKQPTKDLPPARVLGIETSCDETAAAVVENGRVIQSNVVASQADLHARYGGVFPEEASRQHVLAIHPIVAQALQDAHLDLDDVDAVAVTRGPGLPGALVVGLNAAKGLSLGCDLPLIGVNHLEAHLYSAWLHRPDEPPPPEPDFPLLALIVSGGHTELVLMRDHLSYQRLGGTVDDAAGEAFDKVARMLGLSYPGGPAIQRYARAGDPAAINFPRAWMEGTWDFSFSGLKTAVMRAVKNRESRQQTLPVSAFAASFQAAVVDVLVGKTLEAAEAFDVGGILIVGGVSANEALRRSFQEKATAYPVYIPPIELCTDNAAMIAGAGYFRFVQGQRDRLDMDALPNWSIADLPSLSG